MLEGRLLFCVVAVTALPHIAHGLKLMDVDLSSVHDNSFSWTRAKATDCAAEDAPPVVQLTTMANTGTTWLMYLFEEITHVATQNPQSVPQDNPFRPYLFPDDQVVLRTQCGAQLLLHPNCTSGSREASGVHMAMGDEVEIYKNHYPEFDKPMALFDTTPPIAKTLLVIRNPIDTYLARSRHEATNDPSKVGSAVEVNISMRKSPLDDVLCPMRKTTIGHGIDPLDLFVRGPHEPLDFQDFLRDWVDFFSFWLEPECTEITVIRYEDLCNMNLTEDVLEELLPLTGMVAITEGAVQNAVEKYPPDLSRLGNDVYFNTTLAWDSEVRGMVTTTIKAEIQLIKTFGYQQFLDDYMMMYEQEQPTLLYD